MKVKLVGRRKKTLKLAAFKNPITGATGNLLNVGDWTQGIIGVMFLFIVVAMGQMFTRKLTGAVPMIDGTIDPIITQPASAAGFQKYTV
jgi:hypothetical protein